VIYTIGHSTHSAEEFLSILTTHDIGQLADVRTIPRSRRHPYFGAEALETFLGAHGITYRHFPALGGLRKPLAESVNTAWKHPGFRGYADYMQTQAFARGLEELLTFAQEGEALKRGKTAVMCAEAKWWQCHRRLLSDALLVRGVPVRHIVSPAAPKPHELTEFADVEDGKVIYRGLL
jgi:uncharacterized protein (DUF488 family)